MEKTLVGYYDKINDILWSTIEMINNTPLMNLKGAHPRKQDKDLLNMGCQAVSEEMRNNYANLHTTVPQVASKCS